MKPSRRRFFSLAALAPAAAFAQNAPPQIDGGTQVRGTPITAGPGDIWLPYVPTGPVNGTNAVFTIPAVRKIKVTLNGVEQYQANQLPAGALPNISVVSAAGLTTVTFLSPIPTVVSPNGADTVGIWGTL